MEHTHIPIIEHLLYMGGTGLSILKILKYYLYYPY